MHCLLAHPAAASSTAARAVSAEEGQALADANGMIYEEPATLSYDAEALMLKCVHASRGAGRQRWGSALIRWAP